MITYVTILMRGLCPDVRALGTMIHLNSDLKSRDSHLPTLATMGKITKRQKCRAYLQGRVSSNSHQGKGAGQPG